MAASVATGSPLPESGVLQGGADANVDALIEQSRRLATTPLGDRDRLASLLLAVPFLVVSVALVVFAHSSRQAGLWTLGVFVVSYALASRIDFEIGTGSAVPTQLVLVPMLVLLPVQYVPLCVLVGLLRRGLRIRASSWAGRLPAAFAGTSGLLCARTPGSNRPRARARPRVSRHRHAARGRRRSRRRVHR